MSVDVVDLAVKRLELIEDRIVALDAQIAVLRDDAERLREFVATAKSLLNESGRTSPVLDTVPQRVTIRKGSWAAKVAVFLRDRSHIAPQAQRTVVLQIAGEAGVRPHDPEWNKVSNLINSAIWRRRSDLFVREGELLKLRTMDFELVEGLPNRNEGEQEEELDV